MTTHPYCISKTNINRKPCSLTCPQGHHQPWLSPPSPLRAPLPCPGPHVSSPGAAPVTPHQGWSPAPHSLALLSQCLNPSPHPQRGTQCHGLGLPQCPQLPWSWQEWDGTWLPGPALLPSNAWPLTLLATVMPWHITKFINASELFTQQKNPTLTNPIMRDKWEAHPPCSSCLPTHNRITKIHIMQAHDTFFSTDTLMKTVWIKSKQTHKQKHTPKPAEEWAHIISQEWKQEVIIDFF